MAALYKRVFLLCWCCVVEPKESVAGADHGPFEAHMVRAAEEAIFGTL
jgi:hypothetical protein